MRGVALHSELTIGLADELNVAPLGVGAWAWGTTRLWGYGKEYNRSDVGRAFPRRPGAGPRGRAGKQGGFDGPQQMPHVPQEPLNKIPTS